MSADAIETVIDFLKRYPNLKIPYEYRQDAIRALPSSENGHEVALLVNPGYYTVCYASWHLEFSEERQAVDAFLNGLSDGIRLKVASRGKVDYRWTIQYREGDGWISGSTVRIFRYPFWKRKEIRYLQNDYFIANSRGQAVLRS